MTPKPTDPPGGEPKQRRISTGLSYPDQAAEALELAERLGNALERHRVGVGHLIGLLGFQAARREESGLLTAKSLVG